MHVVLSRHPGSFLRLLEQGADIDVESKVGIRSGDYFGAAVVSVLSHLGDEDAGATPVTAGKLVGYLADLLNLRVAAEFGLVDSTHGTDDSLVSVELFF
jgi:hypothetical protein